MDDLAGLAEVSKRQWSFDADGAMFRLASEARRMQQAHLADPFAAVDTSNIDPYPHQIEAVYNRLLTQRPLRFLLADDPGAGKTIMSGLLIRELVLRGDVARCLIVAPGSLVEQWQDELWDKFGLLFELMSRAVVEASRTGNPFMEKNLLIARVDQLSRSEELMAKVQASDWDLVIVDEAHKMSAHRYGDELRRTKRFVLGETLRECTRHLLLLTATPHNGKNEDFLAFMTLIDPERFAGRLRDGSGGSDTDGDGNRQAMPDVSDVMRRLVKENLRTFEGKRLFPAARRPQSQLRALRTGGGAVQGGHRLRARRHEPGRSDAGGGRQEPRDHCRLRSGRSPAPTGLVTGCHLPLAAPPEGPPGRAGRGVASPGRLGPAGTGDRPAQGREDRGSGGLRLRRLRRL